MECEHGAMVEWWQQKTKILGEKPVLAPHQLPWDIHNLDECQS